MNAYRTNEFKVDELISAEEIRKQFMSDKLFVDMVTKLMEKIKSTASKGFYDCVFVDVCDLYKLDSDQPNKLLSKQEEYLAAKLIKKKFQDLGYNVRVRKEGSSISRPDIRISWKPKFSYWFKDWLKENIVKFWCFLIVPFTER